MTGLTDDQRARARNRRAAIAACGRCDPNGWIVIANKAHRCNHQDALDLDQGPAQPQPTEPNKTTPSDPPAAPHSP
ncbi:hypothetical protein KNU39_gp61 [Gordonia phage Mutzi]|uniref:Uncharacterized protein n=1 Tax=Gordonia phage Mutzi TaxID=2500789 RepID=A0A411AXP8_9CAUD|nr:hypothetical protein KNU39_gp61 [Gordonia phage Mutzi]QAX92872.1 hypothetical protein SEA_MUTZI_61 [Gordonia phage Mutzi]